MLTCFVNLSSYNILQIKNSRDLAIRLRSSGGSSEDVNKFLVQFEGCCLFSHVRSVSKVTVQQFYFKELASSYLRYIIKVKGVSIKYDRAKQLVKEKLRAIRVRNRYH